MFSRRFDAVMNIAEVSNSQLGRDVHMNPSYIGRLRSGARPLPKRHDYLPSICSYLARHITKKYQINALSKLTGIDDKELGSADGIAIGLEGWLLENDTAVISSADQLLLTFASLGTPKASIDKMSSPDTSPMQHEAYFFGNEGKRRAIKHFFRLILKEEKPQTLLLFSDENMDWLYEDATFSKEWLQLFRQVLAKGNHVKVIHSLSRDIHEMIEGVSKWLPIYMTGNVEPYYYPRIRDGVMKRTLFIAPETAAITSVSIQQNTQDMLNLLLTDHSAVLALNREFSNYMSLCRPMLHIFTEPTMGALNRHFTDLNSHDGANCLYGLTPPLFTMPEELVHALAKEYGSDQLITQWVKDLDAFKTRIRSQSFTVILPSPDTVIHTPVFTCFSEEGLQASPCMTYDHERYEQHIAYLPEFAGLYENFHILYRKDFLENMIIYVKDGVGAIVIKINTPQMAFVVDERNITNALWDYLIAR